MGIPFLSGRQRGQALPDIGSPEWDALMWGDFPPIDLNTVTFPSDAAKLTAAFPISRPVAVPVSRPDVIAREPDVLELTQAFAAPPAAAQPAPQPVVRHRDMIDVGQTVSIAPPAAISTFEQPSTSVAERKSGTFRRWLTRPITMGRLLRTHTFLAALIFVGPGAYYQVDKNTGGALTEASADKALNAIVASYHFATDTLSDAEKRKWIAQRIDNLESVYEFLNAHPGWLYGLNKSVQAALANSNNNPDAAKRAAIEYQLTGAEILAVKVSARGIIYKQTHPNASQRERNLWLARGFVDDLIQKTKCDQLSKTGLVVTEADVRKLLALHADLINGIPGGDGFRSGLIELYPELHDVLNVGEDPDTFAKRIQALKDRNAETERQLAQERAAGAERARAAAETQRQLATQIKTQGEQNARLVASTVGLGPVQGTTLWWTFKTKSKAWEITRCHYVAANAKAKGLVFDERYCYAIKDLDL